MPISNLTALIIKTDDIVVTSGGPAANGKYVGWITRDLMDRYRPLVNSDPIYDTPELAKEAMQRFVDKIRNEVVDE
jgi:hypothetical protein